MTLGQSDYFYLCEPSDDLDYFDYRHNDFPAEKNLMHTTQTMETTIRAASLSPQKKELVYQLTIHSSRVAKMFS